MFENWSRVWPGPIFPSDSCNFFPNLFIFITAKGTCNLIFDSFQKIRKKAPPKQISILRRSRRSIHLRVFQDHCLVPDKKCRPTVFFFWKWAWPSLIIIFLTKVLFSGSSHTTKVYCRMSKKSLYFLTKKVFDDLLSAAVAVRKLFVQCWRRVRSSQTLDGICHLAFKLKPLRPLF